MAYAVVKKSELIDTTQDLSDSLTDRPLDPSEVIICGDLVEVRTSIEIVPAGKTKPVRKAKPRAEKAERKPRTTIDDVAISIVKDALQTIGTAAASEIVTRTGFNKPTVARILAALVEAGDVTVSGAKRGTRYTLATFPPVE